jgi:tetratricopeptide (TPR) repeat protein
MVGTFIIAFLLQSFPMPPRSVIENPAALSPVPKKVQKDFDKLWQRFLKATEDPKVLKDGDKLLKKNNGLAAVLILEAYVDLYNGDVSKAESKLWEALAASPSNRIALSYLADVAFNRSEFGQASDLYARLLEADPSRTDVEAKRDKALLLATQSLIRNASGAEQDGRNADAESLYRQALKIVPRDPSLHERLGLLLGKENKWDEALEEFRKAKELGAQADEADRNIAAALRNLGRADEAGEILDRLRKAGPRDGLLEAKLNDLEDIGRWGSEIERFHEIQAEPELTREQAAALMVRYFPQLSEFNRTSPIITDVQGEWALPEIQVVVGIGLLEPRPNHKYEPSVPITRGEFARALARLTRMLEVPSTASPPITTSDVSSSSALYADVQLVLDHDLMALDESGNFNVAVVVSGASGVRAVKRLLELSRGVFQQRPH